MVTLCPTITAKDGHDYRSQMERVASFTSRVHIDLADGVFTDNKLVDLSHIWWPDNVTADLHIMYQQPMDTLEYILKFKPSLVIAQAEADGNFLEFARKLHSAGIRAGISLLAITSPLVIEPALAYLDHVLIFSGNLGHFGGYADMTLLDKVRLIRSWDKKIEIGWDGGINPKNINQLVEAGVDVLNVGGSIQRAKDPGAAYATLKELAEQQA